MEYDRDFIRNIQSKKPSRVSILPLLLIPMIWLYFIICWVVNLFILLNCDFEESYREEFIHGIGLIGPVAGVTVWM